MSVVAERDRGLPDQEQEGGRMDHVPGQSGFHVLPIHEAVDDIDGTTGFLRSQADSCAIMGEEPGQQEIWPDVEDIWPHVEEVWPCIKDIWPDICPVLEEAWPDVEEDLYVWNSDQEKEVVQEEAEDDQDYNNEEEEEEDNKDDNYEYEKKGEDEVEDQGKEIILHAIKGKGSHG
ncbi:myelin transcription factor 1-like [Peromyscus californicus insignis]|uniref:myelin transcription factor 1-like n=1 Tax=Peromyscus californicus insignis TaxID=564181 RepID=UPI0022A680B3|nr:myelin transcription factor 1-like [Peromyscus californicus insignis]XP_052605189.1 myelin transcription factor 1-like [Peromyscus californicus insignis]XP_052605190.1 myelin transcription factor 1-like [Peromyscus californicus insignis]